MVRIRVNEVVHEYSEPPKLMEVRARLKPDADVIVRNGFPASDNVVLEDGDSVVLIRRGEMPARAELEAQLSARHTPGVHERVKSAVVGIAGVGGLGSSVALALARVGVGKLVIADYDVVEPSNLNRQQYFVDQIGSLKVNAMEDNLRRVNPFVKVVRHNVVLDAGNIPGVFRGVDVLVEALDRPESKAELVDAAAGGLPGVPVVCASGIAGYGPSNTIITRPFAGRCHVVGDLETGAAEGVGLMAPRVGIAAHHQANCVLRILLGEKGG
ncbi:MAG TPA: sulfur carrier protein ThiS adenylyltransferase ThiF [Nitrospirota bacterium]|jgi:sulfur carrier protein ThiS adenylyltransferase